MHSAPLPVAALVAAPVAVPTALAAAPGPATTVAVACRQCGQPFAPRECDRGSAAYYRCSACHETLLAASLAASCALQ
jgi:predicted SprT family Zn-dependent metalloprotease